MYDVELCDYVDSCLQIHSTAYACPISSIPPSAPPPHGHPRAPFLFSAKLATVELPSISSAMFRTHSAVCGMRILLVSLSYCSARLALHGNLGLAPSKLDWNEEHAGRFSGADFDFDHRCEVAGSISQLVGRTPMVYLDRIARGLPGRLAAKLEYLQAAGSMKDRIALNIIEGLEQQGTLVPGESTILEVTSGNTGIALAAIAASRGYRVKVLINEGLPIERKTLLLALGAELIPVRSMCAKEVLLLAERMAREDPSLVFVKQFESAANPAAHFRSTGPEIWNQTRGAVDALVAGVGTGGTLTGGLLLGHHHQSSGTFLKAKKHSIRLVAVEPVESAVLSGGPPGGHGILGIGAGFIPRTLDAGILDEILPVSTEEAMAVARRLARAEGILAGVSSGSNVAAALQIAARPESAGKLIVTLLPSAGERYLSTPLFQEARELAAELLVLDGGTFKRVKPSQRGVLLDMLHWMAESLQELLAPQPRVRKSDKRWDL